MFAALMVETPMDVSVAAPVAPVWPQGSRQDALRVSGGDVVADDAPARGPEFQAFLRRRAEGTGGLDVNSERLPWPDDWFGPCDSGEARACRKIFGAALFELVFSMLLAQQTFLTRSAGRNPSYNVGAPSFSWLRTKDFMDVCDLAGLDIGCAETLSAALQAIETDAAQIEAVLKRMRGGRAADTRVAAE